MRNQRTYSAVLNNGIPITLCHRAVKLFRISVKPDGSVEAVAPWRMSRETALRLANERADWVREHRAKFLERGAVQYANGELVPLWGVKCPLRVVSGKPGAQFDGEYIVLSAPEDSGAEARRAALLTLYRRELERAIPPLVSKYAAALDVAAPKWSLRDMRSRWGSCTPARGTVRFSLALAAKPPECLEYVVAHELAHLRIHGHGPDFHALVRSVYPHENAARALLRSTV